MSVYSFASGSVTPIGRRLYGVTSSSTTQKLPAYTSTPNPKMNGAATGSIRDIAISDIPLSVVFDDMMRHYDHYNNYSSENEFLAFVNSQELCRKKWFEAEQDVVRLNTELQNLRTELERNDKKMSDFRRQFESKLEVVSRLETENELRKIRLHSASTIVKACLNDIRIGVDVKEKFAHVLSALEGFEYKRNPVLSPGGALDTISEADTTDLSMTHSEDDLDFSVNRRTRNRNKRPSLEMQPNEATRKKIRISNGTKQTASGGTDQVISQTIVSIPKSGGPVHAVSTLETIPSNGTGNCSSVHRVLHTVHPSAPPMTGTSETDSEGSTKWVVKPHYKTRSSISKTNMEEPPAQSPLQSRFGRTLSSTGGTIKNHSFVTKTVIKPECCEPCGKRIKFSKSALKCKDCRATCHPECRDKVPLPCVATSTPSNRGAHGQLGIIADYTPNTHPMVPALIQHCVNEIEVRGLSVVGLYRVPGSEKAVKDLKERFLRGKGVPNLTRYDPHVICGCVKDFLRSLHEPLVGRWFWRDFALATDITDPIKRQAEIHRTLDELPPPNQDTLAFVILHLQKVGEIPEIKMPLSNLAKVFGPTIIGYSSYDLDTQNMIKETKKQQLILETLLSMSSEYWRRFIHRPQPQVENNNIRNVRTRRTRFSSIGRPSVLATVTQLSNKSSKEAKKIYFQDSSSPRDTQNIRPKRNYFD